MKKIFLTIFLLFLILFFFLLKQETTRSISINFTNYEYKIPVYVKLFDFMQRHLNYKYLVDDINKDHKNDRNKVINLSKWIFKNIQKISPSDNIDIVDHHPLTIVERRLGKSDQFSDILSVLLVYSNIDSFSMVFDNHTLTFFNIDNRWFFLDPYLGIFFINDEKDLVDVDDIKQKNWKLSNLNLVEINTINFNDMKKNFNKKFDNLDQLKVSYQKIINQIPSSDKIDNKNRYERGGRSYVQDPIGRIKYEIYKKLN